jgi:hypothetical protein
MFLNKIHTKPKNPLIMKLIPIKNSNRAGKINFPMVSFTTSGYMALSGTSQEKYGFKEGDHIMIVQNEEQPDDFYIIVTENQTYPKIKFSSNKKTLKAGYVSAYRKIVNHFGLENKSFRLALGGALKTELGRAIYLDTKGLRKGE